MKKYTTPTLPIIIRMPFDEVQSIEFVFKPSLDDDAEVLIHKEFKTRDSIPVEVAEDGTKFTVNTPFTLKETADLTTGPVYMDTHIVLTDGSVPETKIVKHIINPSLFVGVHNND